jgi:hypothetical protein
MEVLVSTNRSDPPLNTRLLITGAVLTGLGGMVATLGLALGSAAVLAAARRWQQRTEMTPAQLAKHAYDAAQTARTAGWVAWREPTQADPRRAAGALRSSTDDGAGIPVG